MKKNFFNIDHVLGKLYPPFILLIMSLVLFVYGYPFVQQTTTEIKLNTVATQTIRANKSVEDVNATEKARNAAARSVAVVYTLDETLATKKVDEVSKFFTIIQSYRTRLDADEDAGTTREARLNTIVSQFFTSLNHENAEIQSYAYTYSESFIKQLLNAADSSFLNYQNLTKTVVQTVLSDQIYPTDSDISEAKEKANSLILTKSYVDSTRDVVRQLVSPAIVATMVISEEATNQQKELAISQTPAVYITQGDVIVREGEVVTQTIYNKLALLNMINNQSNVQLLLGYVLILIMQFCLVWYFINRQAPTLTKRAFYANLYAFMAVLVNGLLVVGTLLQRSGVEYIGLIIPLGIVPLIMIPKSKRRLSIILLCFAISIYYFVSDDKAVIQAPFMWKFYTAISFLTTVVISGNKKKPLAQHFLVLWAMYIGFSFALAMYYNIDLLSRTFGLILIFVTLNVVLTVLLLKLGQPYFDLFFEDKAVLKMLELSNPNQPLLKELIAKAPGTYHHSIMVANLSANAVEAIGGDSLFTRVACYYHDVGKLKNPMFFTENLPSGVESPHTLLTPFQSRDVIFEHVSEGVRRLTVNQLPQSIIDICAQHHGTTIMKYFYIMAKEKDETVSEDAFRYPGPKPQTKEAAVISIADTVEAAAKSMQKPTKEQLEKLVKDTIKSRILDGQFDEAPITMEELKIVQDSLIMGLSGSYHTRVEYPKLRERK